MASAQQIKNASMVGNSTLLSEQKNLAASKEENLLDYLGDLNSFIGMIGEINDPFGVCGILKSGTCIIGRIAKIRENHVHLRRMAHDISTLAPILVNISKNFNVMSQDKKNTIQPAIRTLYSDFEEMQAFTEKLAKNGTKKPGLLKKIVATVQESLTTEKIASEIKDFRDNMQRSISILNLGMSSVNSAEQQMRDDNPELDAQFEQEMEEDILGMIMEMIENENYSEALEYAQDQSECGSTNADKAIAMFMVAIIYSCTHKHDEMFNALTKATQLGLSDVEFVNGSKKIYFTDSLKSKPDQNKWDRFYRSVEENFGKLTRYQNVLTEAQIDFYAVVFDAYDADHGGKIDQDEFRAMMKAANPNLTRKAIDDFLRSIDDSGDNEIDMDEWLNLMADLNENPNLFPGLDPQLSFFKQKKEDRVQVQQQAAAEFIPAGKGKGKKSTKSKKEPPAKDSKSKDKGKGKEKEKSKEKDKKKKK